MQAGFVTRLYLIRIRATVGPQFQLNARHPAAMASYLMALCMMRQSPRARKIAVRGPIKSYAFDQAQPPAARGLWGYSRELHFLAVFAKIFAMFAAETSIEQSGLTMETTPQHQDETGRWLRLSAARGHEGPERGGVFPETEGTSRLYTIREMARDFQVSIRTLRFYEDRGLLHPRREGANRRYDSRDRLHSR